MRLKDLLEASIPPLNPDVRNTLSPTMVMPDLINSDTYRQYRYNVALAAVRAMEAGEVDVDIQSTWNESLAAVAYTDAELETINLANKLMNISGIMISSSPSCEPKDTNTVSPVAKFSMIEGMRGLINKLSDE
jgi:hypothetical protein